MDKERQRILSAVNWIDRNINMLIKGDSVSIYQLGYKLGEIAEAAAEIEEKEDIFDLMRMIHKAFGPNETIRMKESDRLLVVVKDIAFHIKRQYQNEYGVGYYPEGTLHKVEENYQDPAGVLAFIEQTVRKEADKDEPQEKTGEVQEEVADSSEDNSDSAESDIWAEHIAGITGTGF